MQKKGEFEDRCEMNNNYEGEKKKVMDWFDLGNIKKKKEKKN